MILLKNTLYMERIRLAHPYAKKTFMLRDRGRFVGIVITESTLRRIGDRDGDFQYIQIKDKTKDISFC